MAGKELPEIRIKHISPRLHGEFMNIVKNLGTDASSLLKTKLREIVDSYPEKYRQPPPEY